ncbi:MAG: phosphatase PAP2 family protein [Candidatus Woesearchaeota archaeon]
MTLFNRRRKVFSRIYLYALAVCVLSTYLYINIVDDLVNKETVTNLDQLLYGGISSLWSGPLTQFMVLITNLGSTFALLSFSVALGLVLAYRKKWYKLVFLAASMLLGLMLELLTKQFVQRPRPDGLIPVTGYSFPSGHATMAIIFFAVALFTYKGELKALWLWYSFVVLMVALPLLIAFSRIYLRVHYFSDVIGGLLLGVFVLCFTLLVLRLFWKTKNLY